MRVFLTGIFACFLLLMTVQTGMAQQAELPTWDVGLTWAIGKPDIDLTFTYTIMDMTVDVTGSGSYYVIYKVGAIEGQEYRVDVTGGLDTIMDIDISGVSAGQQVSGFMQLTMTTKLDGTVYYTKNELAVARADETLDIDMDFSGSVTGGGQAVGLNGSLDASGNMSITFNPSLEIFDFPITVGESWTAESVATVTGSMSGSMSFKMVVDGGEQSFSEPISESLDQTVNVSLSVSCPRTVDIPLASTCYELVVSGTGMAQACPFMPASVLYYSPDSGFVVAAELPFCEALSSASFGSEEDIPLFGEFMGGEETIALSSVTEQEARDAIAGIGAEGIDIVLIGAIVGIVIVAIAAVLVVVRRKLA
ncbi:MAG: hypothetical protein AVW05_01260 [Hadesarchaea archaeon DG-33]|nr:MAG: hypothetical protein AVW05_01260 [Hadesarchaea archaeon DG-33]